MKKNNGQGKSTLDRLDAIEEMLSRLEGMITGVLSPAQQHILNEMENLKTQTANIGKTVWAVTSILGETNLGSEGGVVLPGDSVLKRIRDFDEQTEKQRLQSAVQSGLLAASDVVSDNSVVAVSVKSEEGTELSGFSIIEMNSLEESDPSKSAFRGKTVGDSVSLAGKDGSSVIFSLLEVLDFVEVGELQAEESKEQVASVGQS